MQSKVKSTVIMQSVVQAFDILEMFRDNVDEVGITELSNTLNLTKNKVFRLVATLESRKYLEQKHSMEKYRLGLNCLQLGQTYIKQIGLSRQVRPVLESLAKTSNETSYVAILRDTQVVCLDAIESGLPVRVVPRVGAMLPLYCTSVGKVLAADFKEGTLWKYIPAGILKRYTPNTISDPEVLAKQLLSIAKLGYAVDNEEMDLGVKGISAPFRDYTRQAIGAVSVAGPSQRLTDERMNDELIPMVMNAAREISASLGYY